MYDNAYIDEAKYKELINKKIKLKKRKIQLFEEANFYSEEVRRIVNETYGYDELYKGGLSIRTPLNSNYQIESLKALSIGLINNVFETKKLEENVLKIANKIASKSSATIKIGKDAFYKQKDMSLKEAYDYTSKIMTENMLHKDSEEGITAFLEKRLPNWKD